MVNDLSSLPRVLIVSPHGFNCVTAGGVTFSNLFKGWPKDKLAIVHNDRVPLTEDVCARHYRLSDREVRLAPYLSLFGLLSAGRWARGFVAGDRRQGPAIGEAPNAPASDGPANSETTDSSILRARGRVLNFLRYLFGGELPHRARLSNELEAWVGEFRPQIIYSVLGSDTIMDLVRDLVDRFDVPVVVHLMDDWRATQHRNGMLSIIERCRMLRAFGESIRSASVRMGICPAMCADYQRRYGVEFLPFQNPVDIEEIRNAGTEPEDDWFSVAYTGSIHHYAQSESLADVCKAVVRLRSQGVRIKMDIYSTSSLSRSNREALVVSDCIRLFDAVPDRKDYFKNLANANVLLLPVNFDDFSRRMVRLSMPTKVPEYLAVGRPILAYGPADVAQMEYAQKGGWGLAVTRRGVSHVENALERLMNDNELRRTLSEAALSAANAHDARVVRPAFRSAISDSIR